MENVAIISRRTPQAMRHKNTILSTSTMETVSLHKLKLNSVALVRKLIIPTEQPPLVGEVSANFLRIDGVAWSAQRIPTAVNLDFLDPEPPLFNSISSSVILKRLNGARS
jgi:hypothetical protein